MYTTSQLLWRTSSLPSRSLRWAWTCLLLLFPLVLRWGGGWVQEICTRMQDIYVCMNENSNHTVIYCRKWCTCMHACLPTVYVRCLTVENECMSLFCGKYTFLQCMKWMASERGRYETLQDIVVMDCCSIPSFIYRDRRDLWSCE